MSVATVRDYARQLCAHIKLLKGVHRSGATPSFGQVDDLFELADGLEHALDRMSAETPTPTCTRPACAAPGTVIVAGRPYCEPCGDAVRKLLKNIESFGMQPVRGNWPAPSHLGQVTGLDPRD